MSNQQQQPTVGRIVHFHAGHDITDTIRQCTWPSNYPPGKPLAAIITDVNPRFDDDAWYAMADGGELPDQSMVVRLDIRYPGPEDPRPEYGPLYPYSETPKPGHWTWPPRT